MATRKKRKAAHTTVKIVGKRRRSTHTRRKVGASVGSSAVGKTRRRKRKSGGMVGSTHEFKQIGVLAAGMVGGAVATHFALRPLESKLVQRFPMAGKLMGAAEIIIGGLVTMRGKSPLIKGIGLGIMAGGVNTVMHQFQIGHPAITGAEDYNVYRVPLNGSMTNMLAGVIENRDIPTNSEFVAGTSEDLYRTYLLAGHEEEEFLNPKGYEF